MRSWFIFILCLATVPVAYGRSQLEQILVDENTVLISKNRRRPWQEKDPVCFMRKRKVMACGKVVANTDKGVFVELTAIDKLVKVGDKAVSHQGRQLASAPLNLETEIERPKYTYDLVAGLNMALDRVFPKLEWQGYITPHLSFGFQTSMAIAKPSSGADDLLAIGGLFTINYYSKKYYRGLWLQGASGLMLLKYNVGGTSVTARSPHAQFTVGYRENWGLGFNIGIGVGARYIDFTTTSNSQLNFASFAPIIVTDIGFNY